LEVPAAEVGAVVAVSPACEVAAGSVAVDASIVEAVAASVAVIRAIVDSAVTGSVAAGSCVEGPQAARVSISAQTSPRIFLYFICLTPFKRF
jgi:hypothetical protein